MRWGGTAFCVAVFVLCLWVAHPVLEAGYSDDFSYIFTAKRAAETGRLIYNGWACPMLGFQVYLAALLIRIFGFSFTVTRAAVWLIAIANVAVLHRLFLRLTVRPWNAVVAALCVALGPITFSHSVVFFTDLPGQFAFVVALFCCVRAIQAEDAASTRRWLLWCVVLNLLLGTVRQTAWLGALVLLPAVGWRLRHRAGVLRTTAVLWLVSIALVGAGVLWLSHAPYAPQEALLPHLTRSWLQMLPLLPVLTLFELLPLLLTLPAIREARRNRRLMAGSAVLALVVLSYGWWMRTTLPGIVVMSVLHAPFAYAAVLGLVVMTGLAFLGAMAWQEGVVAFRSSPEDDRDSVSFRTLVVVLWPYLVVVSALVMTREASWARYILPLTPALAALLLRLHTERTKGSRLSAMPVLGTVLWGVMAVVIAHDDLLQQVPVLRLKQRYLAMGLPRQQLETGMVEDGWYEVSTGHHINEPRIREPKDAYQPRAMTAEQKTCHTNFLPMAPDIHPIYLIGWWTSPCVQQPALATETQSFWMRPSITYYLYRFIPSQQMP